MSIVGATYSTKGPTPIYGTAPDEWAGSVFADPGQTGPTVTWAAGSVGLKATVTGSTGSVGFALLSSGQQCITEANFARGLTFTLSGNLGGCSLFVDALTAEDQAATPADCRGTCPQGGPCTPPTEQVTMLSGTVYVTNMNLNGGAPQYPADVAQLIGFRWRLASSGGSCTADVTISNVQFMAL